MKKIALILALSGFLFQAQAKQDTLLEKRIYQIQKLSGEAPLIDGVINEGIWDQVSWSGDFIQHQPYAGRKASHDTRFKLLHDEDFIYVAIEAFDSSPDSIVSRMSRRDDLEGDFVFVDFDSYHDLRTAFAFMVNAGGVKGDFIISNDGNEEDETWDPVWWVKTSIGMDAWYAEMKIPFSQLRFDNSSDGIWGFEVGRSIFRLDEMSMWQHIPPDSPGFIHMAGELHGMKGVKPRKQAEITPYLTAGIKNYPAEEGNPYRDGRDPIRNFGVDAKIGLTNNLTLDLSVNPDFGQVEADPSQVNLSAYETFFEEKRPLFIEGKNIYDFPLRWGGGASQNLFYSRRIGRRPHYYPELEDGEYMKMPEQSNIIAAAKVSGKTSKGTSIGILESVTAEEYASINMDGNERNISVEPLTNYFVGRVKQDINDGNTVVGGIITSTYRQINDDHLNFLPYSSITGGIDFQQYWGNKGYNIQFVNYFSHISGSTEAITDLQYSPAHLFQRPGADYIKLDTMATSLSGFGGNLQFWKTSGKFNMLAALLWKSPGFDVNDLGFFRMGDEIMEVVWVGYNFYEPFSIFRRLHVNIDEYRSWDFGGNRAVSGIETGFNASFKNFWRMNLYINTNDDIRFNSLLRGGQAMIVPGSFNMFVYLSTDERKKLILQPTMRLEQGFQDFGNSYRFGLEFEFKPIDALNFSIEPSYYTSNEKLQYVSQEETEVDDRYIFASLEQSVLSLDLRANLTLSPELTIQYWGQPFIAKGRFFDYKYITDGLAENFNDRFYLYDESELLVNIADEEITVNENSGIDPYSFYYPDFARKEFLSNLVIRWEYRPGSYLYAVWSQNRFERSNNPGFSYRDDIPEIWNIEPENIFLLKLTYRLGR